jgi:hypothetical protein
MMSCPSVQKASSVLSTAWRVSQSITPIPCVPWWSFTIAGGPPTSARAASMWAEVFVQTVMGMSRSLRVRSCIARSLSRERAMATAWLSTGTPIMSNWRTTARPYWVTDAPMRGITRSKPDTSAPRR